MQRVISVPLAHNLHLHRDCCVSNNNQKADLNHIPPLSSNAELKVFGAGLVGGCHPSVGMHTEEHSSPRTGRNPLGLEPLLPHPSVSCYSSVLSGFGGGKKKSPAIRLWASVSCARRSRILKRLCAQLLHIMRCFQGYQVCNCGEIYGAVEGCAPVTSSCVRCVHGKSNGSRTS